MHITIMAGGIGTRLWPLSTRKKPKYLLDLTGRGTLISETVRRLLPLAPEENIFIVTRASDVEEIQAQVPNIPSTNIIAEPVGRNTLPCAGLGALHIRRKDANSVMALLPADGYIEDEKRYVELLAQAAKLAQSSDVFVTLGIKPTRPETGYGYLKLGQRLSIGNINAGKSYVPETVLTSQHQEHSRRLQAFKVEKFTEKPSREEAVEFLKTGKYLWNGGIFIAKARVLLDAIEEYEPAVYAALMQIDKAIGTTDERQVLAEVYPKVKNISIDYGIMEKLQKSAGKSDVIAIVTDVGWNDIGSWQAMEEIWATDENQNVCKGEHLNLDTHGCIIYSPNKPVATIGLKDIVIVETDGVLLVCSKERAQEVKNLVSG